MRQGSDPPALSSRGGVSGIGRVRSLLPLLVAASIPIGIVLLIVAVQPSVVKQPELYFAYALLEATAFLLLFRFFDLYEREPLSILALMAAWGGTVAVAIAVIGNTALDNSLPRPVETVFGAAISAPLVEESAKGAALLAAFMVSIWANKKFGLFKFEGLTDGLLYGAAVGLGFALVEDILYFINATAEHGQVGDGLTVFLERTSLLRLDMLLHPLATGAFGAGLGLAAWSLTRRGRIGFPLLGLLLAILTHAAWNGFNQLVLVERYGWHQTSAWYTNHLHDRTLAQQMDRTFIHASEVFQVLWWAFIVLWVVAIALWLRHQREVIRFELQDEVGRGTLSQEELEQILHYPERSKSYWRLLLAGRFEEWRLVRRLHGKFVDLAFLKRRVSAQPSREHELSHMRRSIANVRGELALAASDELVAT